MADKITIGKFNSIIWSRNILLPCVWEIDPINDVTKVKCQAGYRWDPGNPTPGSQVGMVGSHLSHLGWKFDSTWDPVFNAGFLHPTRDIRWDFCISPGSLRQDLCILPGILVGIYISHLWKYCFAVFILTKHFICESSNTYGSSTHSANIWHADKTEVVTVPFEKIHLLNDFFNLLYLKLWSENIFKTRLVSSEK